MMFYNGFVAGQSGGCLCNKRRRQMKTLVNKRNPQIRITAEVETLYDKFRCVKYYYIKDLRLGLLQENWALVEEEPVKEEICSKCVHHRKDDDCYYPYGGMQRRINENGVCECTGFCEKEQEEPTEGIKGNLEDLENYISNKLRELGADLINHKPYSFNRGLNVGQGNAYRDILDKLKARKEE